MTSKFWNQSSESESDQESEDNEKKVTVQKTTKVNNQNIY